jgi:hypothetical protein
VSRRALAAGDLERQQQKRSSKRVSGGDSVVGGGPGARLLGSQTAIRHVMNGRTSCGLHPLGSAGHALSDGQKASLVAEAEVSP